jgi:hypothetical protein
MSNKSFTLKFHYYFVKSSIEGDLASFEIDTNKKLERLLIKLSECNHEEKIWRHNQDDDNMIILQSLSRERNGFWKLNFVKIRDGALPGRLSADGVFSEIILEPDEYIGEDMTIIYSPKYSLLGLQRNFFSVSASKVQDYFSNKEMIFIQDGVSFIFEPIIESKVIPETAILRNVEVSCYDLNGASIEDIISSDNSYGARRITLIYGMGTAPKDKGLLSGIRTILGNCIGDPRYKRVKASYRKDANSPIEAIDFIESKVENRISLMYSKTDPITHDRVYMAFLPEFKKQLAIIAPVEGEDNENDDR